MGSNNSYELVIPGVTEVDSIGSIITFIKILVGLYEICPEDRLEELIQRKIPEDTPERALADAMLETLNEYYRNWENEQQQH